MSVRRAVGDRIPGTQRTHRETTRWDWFGRRWHSWLGVLLAAAGAVVAVFAVEMLTDPSGGDRAGVAIVIGLPIFLIVVRVTTSVLLDRVATTTTMTSPLPSARRDRVDAGS